MAKLPIATLLYMGMGAGLLHAQGALRGTVQDSTGNPIARVAVVLMETSHVATTGTDGRFLIRNVAPGAYEVRARLIGYRPAKADVNVSDGDTARVVLLMPRLPITLADIVVTPGYFSALEERANGAVTLSKEDIAGLPQLGEDLYRSINRLPGFASSELSAKFKIRGGPSDEMLVRLDGIDLEEPFHLKDFDGALSIIDVAMIGRVDVATGGFTSEFGNHETGVLDLRSADFPDRASTVLGLSVTAVRAMTHGHFDGGNGNWLVSARRGYLDLLLKLIGERDDLSPTYYDGFAKIDYILGSHRFGARVLRAGDNLDWSPGGDPALTSGYGSTYAWLTWDWQTAGLSEQTAVGWTSLDWNRVGLGLLDRQDSAHVVDHRSFTSWSARQDWALSLGPRLQVKWGGELKRELASYDYFSARARSIIERGVIVSRSDTNVAALSPDGWLTSAHLASRFRPIDPLTAEVGARYDRASWSGEANWSPRLNLAIDVTPTTTLRAAWGYYFQPEALYQVSVQDGDRSFQPAARAEHRGLGLEQRLPGDLRVRVEAYDRVLARERVTYSNLVTFNQGFPELEYDRVQLAPSDGDARGIEISVQHRGDQVDWSGSYSISHIWDRIAGVEVRRTGDQRHTLYADVSYRPSPLWRISGALTVHSGWPYTPRTFGTVKLADGATAIVSGFAPIRSGTLPTYHRADLRISRAIPMKDGVVSVYLDIFNLYDRVNAEGYSYNVALVYREPIVRTSVTGLLPILPTLGVSWEF
jgi:hypothetical protein